MKTWTDTNDLLAAIQSAHGRLLSGDSDADTAHAEARLLHTAVKTAALAIDHAKLTNRLKAGDDVLPVMRFGTKAK